MTTPTPRPSTEGSRSAFIPVVLLVVGTATTLWLTLSPPCWECIFSSDHQHAVNERSYVPGIKTLTSAQADYRSNDRDGNGKNDYWREDVAGLYVNKSAQGEAICLIDFSLAAADERPASIDPELFPSRRPHLGYWYRAIRHQDETVPGPDRFAFCSFPDDYPESGRWTFIIDERNTVFKRDLGHGRGVEMFPNDVGKS